MALDPSIYAQFLRPPKSMNDYDREALDLESARQGQQSNALQLMMGRQKVDEYQRGVNESNALRELQRSLAGKPEADVVSGYRAAGRFGEAAKLESDMLDRQKKQKDIAKDEATTAKTYGEAQADALKRYRGALDFIDTPQGVARWLQAQYADPLLAQHMQALGPLDQALQRLPQDPAGLQQWRQQAAMGMEKYMEQQLKERELGAKERNDLIGPDGKPNQAVIGAKKDIARAGSSNVSVNTGQKGLDNTLKLRGDFRSEPVYKAHQEMQSAYSQIQQSLKQASPAGDLAGATKLMKLLDPGSVVRESELGMAMAASGLLDRVTNYAQNIVSGNKLTPTQRADFQKLADALYGESIKAYNSKRGEYQGIAERNQLPVADVVGSASAPPGANASPPGGREVNFADLK